MTTLRTERLVLRTAVVADAAVWHELWTERDARAPAHRRIDADGHPTVDEVAARIRDGVQPLLLCVEVDGEVVGYCGLTGDADEPELAYELLRRVWGRGYATEAATAVVAWARASGYRRLWAGVRDWNTASRRVLAKVGFVETGKVEPDAVHGDSIVTTRVLG